MPEITIDNSLCFFPLSILEGSVLFIKKIDLGSLMLSNVAIDQSQRIIVEKRILYILLGKSMKIKSVRIKKGGWMKEGEGISQRIYTQGPWTRTTVWGLPEQGMGGWV